MFYTIGPFIRVKIRGVLNKTQTVPYKRHISSEIRRDIDVLGSFIGVKIRRVQNKTQTVLHKRHISSEIRRDIDVSWAIYTSKNKTRPK